MNYQTLPDGTYEGVWSGHSLRIKISGGEVTTRTDLGVRGINIPVTLQWKGGRVDESTIKPVGHSGSVS